MAQKPRIFPHLFAVSQRRVKHPALAIIPHPRQRMVVIANLVGEPSDLPPPLPVEEAHPDEATPGELSPDEEPGEGSLPVEDDADPDPSETVAFDPAGLSGEGADNTPAILWGLAAAFVWFVAWWFARRFRGLRKWLTYAAFTPVFLVVLFIFFENFSRLLPANY